MDSEVICNPKNYEWLTHSLNNIGLRDASASKNILYQLFFRNDQRLSVTLSNNSNGVLTILMSSFLCLPTWYSFINTKQPSCNSKIMDDMELWTNNVKHPSGLSTNTAFAAWYVARRRLVRPMATRWQHCGDCNAGVGLASLFSILSASDPGCSEWKIPKFNIFNCIQ